ncbi:hypothetical protein SRIMM317S_00208 [Streptomyces rimosus subsp. rimosus]
MKAPNEMVGDLAVEPGVPDARAQQRAVPWLAGLDVPEAPEALLIRTAFYMAHAVRGVGRARVAQQPSRRLEGLERARRPGRRRAGESVGEAAEDLGGHEVTELGVPARLGVGGLGPRSRHHAEVTDCGSKCRVHRPCGLRRMTSGLNGSEVRAHPAAASAWVTCRASPAPAR